MRGLESWTKVQLFVDSAEQRLGSRTETEHSPGLSNSVLSLALICAIREIIILIFLWQRRKVNKLQWEELRGFFLFIFWSTGMWLWDCSILKSSFPKSGYALNRASDTSLHCCPVPVLSHFEWRLVPLWGKREAAVKVVGQNHSDLHLRCLHVKHYASMQIRWRGCLHVGQIFTTFKQSDKRETVCCVISL